MAVIICGVSLGCRPASPGHDFIARDTIAGWPLVDEAAVSLPAAVIGFGSGLLVGDIGSDTLLKLFSPSSGAPPHPVAREGEGPGELRIVSSLQEFPAGSGVLWAFDSQLRRLTAFTGSQTGQLRYQDPPLSIRVPGAPLHVRWLTDSSLIAVGFFEEGRFLLLDRNGEVIRAMGVIPLADQMPPLAAQQALQPSLATRPRGPHVVIGSRYASRLDIYDVRNGELVLVRTPVVFEPPLTVIRRGDLPVFVSDAHTRFGYLDVTATDDRIYALFSGRTRAGFPGRANMGSEIHIFDWDGGLRGAVSLDRDAVHIVVNGGGQRLYAISHNPQPAVYGYDLREVNRIVLGQ
jgi:hypothetical protein